VHAAAANYYDGSCHDDHGSCHDHHGSCDDHHGSCDDHHGSCDDHNTADNDDGSADDYDDPADNDDGSVYHDDRSVDHDDASACRVLRDAATHTAGDPDPVAAEVHWVTLAPIVKWNKRGTVCVAPNMEVHYMTDTNTKHGGPLNPMPPYAASHRASGMRPADVEDARLARLLLQDQHGLTNVEASNWLDTGDIAVGFDGRFADLQTDVLGDREAN
jgi:hypothetical protein